MKYQRLLIVVLTTLLAGSFLFLALAPKADAIPVFSRKYRTSCATCHVAFPKLNAFGEAFLRNGYRMPGGDDQYEADEPVSLGAEPWKRLWPNAIWPGSIPYVPPLAVFIDNQFVVDPDADVQTDFEFPANVALLTGGNFGDTISWFGRINLVAPGADVHVHRLFAQFTDLGTSLLNVRIGQFETAAVPFSSNRMLSHYNFLINEQTFPLGAFVPEDHHHAEEGELLAMLYLTQQEGSTDGHTEDAGAAAGGHQHGGAFALGIPQKGVEIWGVTPGFNGRGGFEYGFGVVNGNGSGNFADTGSNDNNSAKDIYFRTSYKFGGLSLLGNAESAPAQTNNWRDDSLKLGFFGYRGTAPSEPVALPDEDHEHGGGFGVDRFFPEQEGEHDEEPVFVDVEEHFNRWGVDFNLWFRDLNLFGAYMWGETEMHPLVIPEGKADFTGWFTQADYVIYPWLVGSLRYERMDLPHAVGGDIDRWVPNVTALIRANVKATFDALIYPDSDRSNSYLFDLAFAF